MSDLLDRIAETGERARALEARLSDPAVASTPAKYGPIAKELAGIRPLVEAGDRYRKILAGIADAKEMLSEPDPELRELAKAEFGELTKARERLEEEIRELLVPRDPDDERSVILEIRGGAGGEEAALFAADLFRMYSRYADANGWKVEPLSVSETGTGGYREVIASISGDGVFGRLKYERGVHRVQRVPVTESQGRIHTSTVTVAVLPEPEEIDVEVNANDLRIDVYRSSGPGGQSVNTTDSAVRITHVPTGLVVTCQDEKSQHKNKARAMKILRARLLEAEQARVAGERADARRAQVGTGDRSERIRTYNFPQSRVTDHRAGVTVHKLEALLAGELAELIDAVEKELRERASGAGGAS